MRKLVFALVFLTFPAVAAEQPKAPVPDDKLGTAQAFINALEAQRNAALNQVVHLTAELEKAKKEKTCGK